ncbi:hypothetical protein BGZ52_004193 [Haplosporangium bisporale]|nr:hypothetical protein BGZ52_004193 [Haplosporangium bisporale]
MSTEVTKDSVIDREKEKNPEREISSSEAPELDIYTWKDATLGEISLAIKKAIPDMIVQAGPGCLLEFRHMTIEADRSGYTGRDIGTVRLDQVSSISVDEEEVTVMEDVEETETGPFAMVDLEEDVDMTEIDGTDGREEERMVSHLGVDSLAD